MVPTRPDAAVLRAFGVGAHRPQRLVGGRGLTWRVGPVVLRPHDGAVTDWRSGVLADLPVSPAFQVPRPVATLDGGWRAGPWEAWEALAGRADEGRVGEVVAAGRAFQDAVRDVPRPAFLDELDDPWSVADRIAWGEQTAPTEPVLGRLVAAFRPVDEPSRLVHGDLLGNVLFAEGAAPAVIDWPPYWRPAGVGPAIAVVDAVCWHDLPVAEALALDTGDASWRQLLVRALVFRIATAVLLGGWSTTQAARHVPLVRAVTGGGTG